MNLGNQSNINRSGQSGQSKPIETNQKSKLSVKLDLPSLSDNLVDTFMDIFCVTRASKPIGAIRPIRAI